MDLAKLAEAVSNLGVMEGGGSVWVFSTWTLRGEGVVLNWHRAGALMMQWSLGDHLLTLLASVL